MANYYRTKAGDTLDKICWQYYIKEVNLGSAAMAVDPRLLSESHYLENGFLLGPDSELDTKGTLEMVLQANPGLANYPLSLPAGIKIILPDMQAQSTADTSVKLWD